MTWTEIYTKYKDTELMKEFIKYFLGFSIPKFNFNYGSGIGSFDIKDIWGYLICFAETKGIYIGLEWATLDRAWYVEGNRFEEEDGDEVEDAMLWRAEKFFERSRK